MSEVCTRHCPGCAATVEKHQTSSRIWAIIKGGMNLGAKGNTITRDVEDFKELPDGCKKHPADLCRAQEFLC